MAWQTPENLSDFQNSEKVLIYNSFIYQYEHECVMKIILAYDN